MDSSEHIQDMDDRIESSSMAASSEPGSIDNHEGEEHPTDLPDMQALKKKRDGRHRKVSKQQLKATTETVEQLMLQLQETQKEGEELYREVTLLRKREEEKAQEIHKWQNASDSFKRKAQENAKECMALKRQLAELTAARTGEVTEPSQAENLLVEQLQMRLADYESLVVQFADEANRTIAEDPELEMDVFQPTDLSKSFEAGDAVEDSSLRLSHAEATHSATAELERLNAEADAANATASSLYADLERNQALLASAEKQLAEVTTKQHDEAAEFARLRQTAQEELTAARAEVERLQAAASSDTERNEQQISAMAEIETLKLELERLQLAAAESAEQHEASLAAQVELSRVKAEMEELQTNITTSREQDEKEQTAEREIASLKCELERLQLATSESADQHEACVAAQAELGRVRTEMEELQASVSESKKQDEQKRTDAEIEIASLNQVIAKLQLAVSETEEKNSASSVAVSAAEEEIEKLKEALERQTTTASQEQAAHEEQKQLKADAEKKVGELQLEVERLRAAGEDAQANKHELMLQLQEAQQEGRDLYQQVSLLKKQEEENATEKHGQETSRRLQKEREQLQMRLADYESLVVQFAEEAKNTMAEDSALDLFPPTDLSPRFENREELEVAVDSHESLRQPIYEARDAENQERLESAMGELKRLIVEAQKASARESALQADLEHNQALLAAAQKQLADVATQQLESLAIHDSPCVISDEGFQIVIQQRVELEDRMRSLQDHLVENEDTLDELVGAHEQVLELSDRLKIDNAGLQQQLDHSEQEKAVLQKELQEVVIVAREGAARMRSESALQVQSLERSLETATSEIQQAHSVLQGELLAKAARDEELQKVKSAAEAAVSQLRLEVEKSRIAGEEAQAKLEASCSDVNMKSQEIVALSEQLDQAKSAAHEHLTNFQEFSDTWQKTQEELAAAKAEVERLQAAASSEKLQGEEQMVAAQAEVASLKQAIDRLQCATTESSHEASMAAQEEVFRLREEMKSLQVASAEQNEQALAAQTEVATLKQEIERVQRVASENEQTHIAAAQEELNRVKAEIGVSQAATSDMEQQKIVAEREVANLKETIERLQLSVEGNSQQHSAILAAEEKIKGLQNSLDQQATAFSEIQAARAEQEQLKIAAEAFVSELKAKLEMAFADASQKSQECTDLQKNLEEAKDAVREEVAKIRSSMEQQAFEQQQQIQKQAEDYMVQVQQTAQTAVSQRDQQIVELHAKLTEQQQASAAERAETLQTIAQCENRLQQESEVSENASRIAAEEQARSVEKIRELEKTISLQQKEVEASGAAVMETEARIGEQSNIRVAAAEENARAAAANAAAMEAARAEQERLTNIAEATVVQLREEVQKLRVVGDDAQVQLEQAGDYANRKEQEISALREQLEEAKRVAQAWMGEQRTTQEELARVASAEQNEQAIAAQAEVAALQIAAAQEELVRVKAEMGLSQSATSEMEQQKIVAEREIANLKGTIERLQLSAEAASSQEHSAKDAVREEIVELRAKMEQQVFEQQQQIQKQANDYMVQVQQTAQTAVSQRDQQIMELHAKLSEQQEAATSQRAEALQTIAQWESRLQRESELSANASRAAAEEQSRSNVKIRELEKTISQQQKEVEASSAAVMAGSDARLKRLTELEAKLGEQNDIAVVAAEEKARAAAAKAAEIEVAMAKQNEQVIAAQTEIAALKQEIERVQRTASENAQMQLAAVHEELNRVKVEIGLSQATASDMEHQKIAAEREVANLKATIERLQLSAVGDSQQHSVASAEQEQLKIAAEAAVGELKAEAILLKEEINRLELEAQENAAIAADAESSKIALKAELEKALNTSKSQEDSLMSQSELQQALDKTSMVLQTSQGQVQALQAALSETAATASEKEAQLQQALLQVQSLVTERDALRNAVAAPSAQSMSDTSGTASAALQAQLASTSLQLAQEADARKMLEETFRSQMEDAQRNLSALTMEREALRRQLADANASANSNNHIASSIGTIPEGASEDYRKLQLKLNALQEEKEIMLENLRENIKQLARENYDLKNKVSTGHRDDVDPKEDLQPSGGGWLSYVIAPFLTDSDMREIHAETYVEEKLGPDLTVST